jgi:hypothetical protein
MSAGAYRERDILKLLDQGLPDSFDVFHSVDWAAMHQGFQNFGELDAVVVAPSGHLMLLEVKAGAVSVVNDALVKVYSNPGGKKTKDIGRQVRRQYSAMMSRLSEEGLGAIQLGHLLVLADHSVEGGTVGYPRERIVDATQLDSLCHLVKTAVQHEAVSDAMRERVMHFLSNQFDLHPDTSMHVGQMQSANVALAEGLATWMPRITHSDGVYMVDATAGSGKSQLALSLLNDAVRRNLRAAYICFNRPLADHIARLAPPRVLVSTFHEYCAELSRRHGDEPDFSVQSVFKNIENCLMTNADAQVAQLDLLVVDESQDFAPQWIQALRPRLKNEGRLYVMGDRNQQLYGHEALDLGAAVRVTCRDNFRSPRKVVETINQLRLTVEPIQARSVYEGEIPGFHTYTHDEAGNSDSIEVLERCLQELQLNGIKPDQIAVVTFAGRERSELFARSKLAGFSLKYFTGDYDSASNPLWTSGELLVDTLYRFKGQSAPVVVLCEVDFEQLGDKELRKLFVGFTRAQFRLECVLSQRAINLLLSSI